MCPDRGLLGVPERVGRVLQRGCPQLLEPGLPDNHNNPLLDIPYYVGRLHNSMFRFGSVRPAHDRISEWRAIKVKIDSSSRIMQEMT